MDIAEAIAVGRREKTILRTNSEDIIVNMVVSSLLQISNSGINRTSRRNGIVEPPMQMNRLIAVRHEITEKMYDPSCLFLSGRIQRKIRILNNEIFMVAQFLVK